VHFTWRLKDVIGNYTVTQEGSARWRYGSDDLKGSSSGPLIE